MVTLLVTESFSTVGSALPPLASASEFHIYLLGLHSQVSFANRRISECLSVDSRPSQAGLTYRTS